MVTGKRIQICS